MFVNSAVVPLLTQNRELLGQKHNVVSSLRPSPFPSSCRKAEYCKNAEQICVTYSLTVHCYWIELTPQPTKQLKDQSEITYYVLGKILGAGVWKTKKCHLCLRNPQVHYGLALCSPSGRRWGHGSKNAGCTQRSKSQVSSVPPSRQVTANPPFTCTSFPCCFFLFRLHAARGTMSWCFLK